MKPIFTKSFLHLFHYSEANIGLFMNGGYHYPYYFNKIPILTNIQL